MVKKDKQMYEMFLLTFSGLKACDLEAAVLLPLGLGELATCAFRKRTHRSFSLPLGVFRECLNLK
jgi:hypothetical protein